MRSASVLVIVVFGVFDFCFGVLTLYQFSILLLVLSCFSQLYLAISPALISGPGRLYICAARSLRCVLLDSAYGRVFRSTGKKTSPSSVLRRITARWFRSFPRRPRYIHGARFQFTLSSRYPPRIPEREFPTFRRFLRRGRFSFRCDSLLFVFVMFNNIAPMDSLRPGCLLSMMSWIMRNLRLSIL